jgi:hypothetical protein
MIVAGAIYFYPDGVRLPPNEQNVNGVYLYFRMSLANRSGGPPETVDNAH